MNHLKCWTLVDVDFFQTFLHECQLGEDNFLLSDLWKNCGTPRENSVSVKNVDLELKCDTSKDNNNNKGISALGLDIDLGFS